MHFVHYAESTREPHNELEFKMVQELQRSEPECLNNSCDYLKIRAERKAKKSKYDLGNKSFTLKRNLILIHNVFTEINSK